MERRILQIIATKISLLWSEENITNCCYKDFAWSGENIINRPYKDFAPIER